MSDATAGDVMCCACDRDTCRALCFRNVQVLTDALFARASGAVMPYVVDLAGEWSDVVALCAAHSLRFAMEVRAACAAL
jgi:hypothetical protein